MPKFQLVCNFSIVELRYVCSYLYCTCMYTHVKPSSYTFNFAYKQKVQQWLRKVFDGASVPEYSSTDGRVLDALYDMAQRSEERSRQLAILTRDMEQKIAEYDSESMFRISSAIHNVMIVCVNTSQP